MNDTVVFRANRWVAAVLLPFPIMLLGSMGALVLHADDTIHLLGWIFVGVAILMLFSLAASLLRPRPLLAVGPEGITIFPGYLGTRRCLLPWRHVERVSMAHRSLPVPGQSRPRPIRTLAIKLRAPLQTVCTLPSLLTGPYMLEHDTILLTQEPSAGFATVQEAVAHHHPNRVHDAVAVPPSPVSHVAAVVGGMLMLTLLGGWLWLIWPEHWEDVPQGHFADLDRAWTRLHHLLPSLVPPFPSPAPHRTQHTAGGTSSSPPTRHATAHATPRTPTHARPTFPPQSGTSSTVLRLELYFDGRPLPDLTSVAPRFWFRDERRRQGIGNLPWQIRDGYYEVHGLHAGYYGVGVWVDLAPENPAAYPGDLRGWGHVQIPERGTAWLRMDLDQVIHMRTPEDNGSIMPHWGQECQDEAWISGPVRFLWDAVVPGAWYDYRVLEMRCPYQELRTLAAGSTQQRELVLSLPPSAPGHYYLFLLNARHEGRPVGMLMTHGANGYGWDYRFRVR